MKVTLEKDYKSIYTINEVEAAKIVIKFEKDDSYTAKDWAEYAAFEALKDMHDGLDRILEASAETCRRRYDDIDWESYGEGSMYMDVWVRGIAKTYHGYIEFGAYLSDLWRAGQIEFKHRMYIDYTRKQD